MTVLKILAVLAAIALAWYIGFVTCVYAIRDHCPEELRRILEKMKKK